MVTKQNEAMANQVNMILEQDETITGQGGMITEQNETIGSQGEMIIKQNQKVETMSQEIGSLNENLKQLKRIVHPTIFYWEISNDLLQHNLKFQKKFVAVGYVLQFHFIRLDNTLQVHFCLKNGEDYDKLYWPFRAKFHTRLINRDCPDEANEFVSEVIEKQREDLDSKDRIAVSPIGKVFRRTSFSPVYVRLEITVIFC